MKSKYFFSVLSAVSIVAAGTCLTACSSKPTIDFEQCVSADFTGYENEGSAIIRTDNNYILSLLGDMNTLSAASLRGGANLKNNVSVRTAVCNSTARSWNR